MWYIYLKEVHTFNEPIKILPGDFLVAECVYDTTSRNQTTLVKRCLKTELFLFFNLKNQTTLLKNA